MKKRKFYEWLIVVILGIFLFYFIVSYIVVGFDSEEMSGSYSPNSKFLSVEAYSDKLDFGQVFPGYSFNRMTYVDNKHDFPVKVYFFPKGDMSEMVFVYPGTIYLEPNRRQVIQIIFSPSTRNVDFGDYTGKFYTLTRRTIFGV